MNGSLQAGMHPDAEMLSAFAEEALPADERMETLAHLAACERCRTIVAMALPPVEEMLPVGKTSARRVPWFAEWRLAWPVAGLMAVMALVFLSVWPGRHRAGGGGDAVAVVEAPRRPVVEAPRPPVVESPRTPVVAGVPSPNATSVNKTEQGELAKAVPPPTPAPRMVAPDAPRGSALGALGEASVDRSEKQANAAFEGRSRASMAGDREQKATVENGVAAGVGGLASIQGTPSVARPAPPRPVAPAVASTTTVDGARDATVEAMDASPMKALLPAQTKPLAALPSHRAIVSSVASVAEAGRVVALDADGGLFVSVDGGRRWSATHGPWQGHAVALGRVGAAIVAESAAPAKPMVPPPVAQAKAAAPMAMRAIGSAEIRGQVSDATGAVVPGAVVKAMRSNDAGGVTVVETTTDAGGHFVLGGLVPGSYAVDGTAPGFETMRIANVQAGAQNGVLQIHLATGTVSEAVEVTADSIVPAGRVRAKKPLREVDSTPLFEVTTENGERWVSGDGRTWRRK